MAYVSLLCFILMGYVGDASLLRLVSSLLT
jgi:hypothetical protein